MDEKQAMKKMLLEIDKGRNNVTNDELGISLEKFLSAQSELVQKGYIDGPFTKNGLDGTVSKLTPEGRKFIGKQ